MAALLNGCLHLNRVGRGQISCQHLEKGLGRVQTILRLRQAGAALIKQDHVTGRVDRHGREVSGRADDLPAGPAMEKHHRACHSIRLPRAYHCHGKHQLPPAVTFPHMEIAAGDALMGEARQRVTGNGRQEARRGTIGRDCVQRSIVRLSGALGARCVQRAGAHDDKGRQQNHGSGNQPCSDNQHCGQARSPSLIPPW